MKRATQMKKHCQNTQRESTIQGNTIIHLHLGHGCLAEQKVTNNYYTFQFQASMIPEKVLVKKKSVTGIPQT